MSKDNNIDTFGQPIQLTEFYTDMHREHIATIVDWIDAHNAHLADPKQHLTQSRFARHARLSPSLVNQVLGGKYKAPPDEHLKKLLDTIDQLERKQESSSGTAFVKTSVYRIVRGVCMRASAVASFGIVSVWVGVGKTAAIRQYVREHSNTYMIEATPSMTASVLLDALMGLLKIGVSERFGKSRTQDARFVSVIEALAGTSTLLIIDEAETMSHKCLHILRRIRDKAEIGIVLAGTEKLSGLILPTQGEFDQIRSRVCIWPATIKGIKREDADALSQTALDDTGELAQDVLDALWSYSKGSARMLTENLIPAIRDYGIAKGQALDAGLVHAVAQQILNLKAA